MEKKRGEKKTLGGGHFNENFKKWKSAKIRTFKYIQNSEITIKNESPVTN